ncbi:AbiJ-related protein [Pseudomonas sp. LB3P31]
MSGPEGHFFNTLYRDVEQHFVRNNDYANSTVLKHCGAMMCSRQRFIDLIAYVLSPEYRTDVEQKTLVPVLTDLLAADGFTLMVIKEISRRAIYGICRLSSGVCVFVCVLSVPVH